MLALGPIEAGADGVINTLIDVVTPDGLIVVPTYTWDVVNERQPVWNQTLTPSHVGVLTNRLRMRKDAIRSLHPTHSVAAIGSRAREFCEAHEGNDSPCSSTSPYDRLIENKGKVLLLDVDLTCCTLIHCLEEMAGLGEIWSLTPPEPHFCILGHGEMISVLARAHQNYKSANYGRVESALIKEGILNRMNIGRSQMMILDAAALADYLVPRFRNDPHYFW